MKFEALFDSVYPSLFRYCNRLTGDPDQAEDLAQEAFFRLLDRGAEGTEAGLRSWLFMVATNLVRDRSRTRETRRRILSGFPPPEYAPGPEQDLARAEEIQRVRKALEVLSQRDREMLLLRQEGFSYREIAEVADVSHRSVGTILARALQRFAAELSREADQAKEAERVKETDQAKEAEQVKETEPPNQAESSNEETGNGTSQ